MSEPIRIAQVVGKMVGGGLESIVLNYYRRIDKQKYQFDFIVDSDSTQVPRDEIEHLGGRVFVVPPYQHILSYQRALISLFGKHGWPIVHCHENALSVFPLRAAKMAGVPIRIAHSHSTANPAEHMKTALKSVLKTQSNRYPTDRLACSNLAGEWLFGKATSFTVLPNAIETSVFTENTTVRQEVRRELGLSDDVLLVGHIGRFVAQKNHVQLLAIFKALLEDEPNAVLTLVGTGPLASSVKKKAYNLGIADSVRFLGSRSDVARLYQGFDLFCLPSLYEGLPVVGVECQASGTPILASDAITSEAAFTSIMEYEPLTSTSRQWAHHLLAMRNRRLTKSDCAQIKCFDITSCVHRLEELYSEMLAREN